MNNRIFFITGVSGVGKTTLIQPLKELVGERFEVHDFDERGVPNNVGRQWRLEETKYWISVGMKNAEKGTPTVICGFARPSEINDSQVDFILLDANEDIIRQRLWNRYQTPESVAVIERVSGKSVQQFIDDNVHFSSVMREEAQKQNVKIVDTTTLNPEQVANEVAEYVKVFNSKGSHG